MSEWDHLSREELIALLQQQQLLILALRQQIADLQQELARGRSQPPPGSPPQPPSFVKPPRQRRQKKKRRQRKQGFARRRDTPTEVVYHAVDTCPDCERRLCGGWVHRRRQVIEIPLTPVRIIEHVLVARRCGVCGQRRLPDLDLSSEVVGQHRVGARLMSVVSYLKTVGRMPLHTIQSLLELLYGLHLSRGELSEILHAVARRGQEAYQQLLGEVRGSDYVHGDETGWRQDGENGYVWSFSTPRVRYFLYQKSRGSGVVEAVLGEEYAGVVVSDFYSAYGVHLGRHQRCWVHLLRELRALREAHPEDAGVKAFVRAVRSLYRRAKRFQSKCAERRRQQRLAFQEELLRIAQASVEAEVPQRVLAKRLVRFEAELFTFVEYPEVPSENNAAERALRPAVIVRKVSGGTRSGQGSETMMRLMSLFGTWRARGLDVLEACRQMLVGKPSHRLTPDTISSHPI
jgi:hypothetical protein